MQFKSFFDQFLKFIKEVLSHELLGVIEDFNAYVRNDRKGNARSRRRTGVLTSKTLATNSCASQIDDVMYVILGSFPPSCAKPKLTKTE